MFRLLIEFAKINSDHELPFYRTQSGIVGHLLGGYEISSVVHFFAGGLSTTTTNNQDTAGLGLLSSGTDVTPRPDRVGNPNSGPRTISQWFNTSAFAYAPKTQLCAGNARSSGCGIVLVGTGRAQGASAYRSKLLRSGWQCFARDHCIRCIHTQIADDSKRIRGMRWDFGTGCWPPCAARWQ